MTDNIQGGFVQVPRIPTLAMLDAACQAMRHRQETMGPDWTPVSNKARILWEAMLAAWEVEQRERHTVLIKGVLDDYHEALSDPRMADDYVPPAAPPDVQS